MTNRLSYNYFLLFFFLFHHARLYAATFSLCFK